MRLTKLKEELVERETLNTSLQRNTEKIKQETARKDTTLNDLQRKGSELKDQLVDNQARTRELQVVLFIIISLINCTLTLFNKMVLEDLKGLLHEKEEEIEEMRKEKEVLISQRNNLDDQFTHLLRKMKRLEKENLEIRESYHCIFYFFQINFDYRKT